MKKIILFFTLLVIASMHISAKNFYYKGISLEYKKGSFMGTGNESSLIQVNGRIGFVFLSIAAEKLKDAESGTDAVTTYLDEIRTNLENTGGDLRIERSGDIKDGALNEIEGQQFDVVFKKKALRIGQRVFCYIQDGWRVCITYSETGKEINEKKFASILQSFNFTPE